MRLDPTLQVALAHCEGTLTDSVRLGHLWVLSAFSFDLVNWLELYAMTSPVLTAEVMHTIVAMTQQLRRQNAPLQSWDTAELGLTFSVDVYTHPLPWEDVIDPEVLRAYLAPYEGCRWGIGKELACEPA
jgi:hypothetical protein